MPKVVLQCGYSFLWTFLAVVGFGVEGYALLPTTGPGDTLSEWIQSLTGAGPAVPMGWAIWWGAFLGVVITLAVILASNKREGDSLGEHWTWLAQHTAGWLTWQAVGGLLWLVPHWWFGLTQFPGWMISTNLLWLAYRVARSKS